MLCTSIVTKYGFGSEFFSIHLGSFIHVAFDITEIAPVVAEGVQLWETRKTSYCAAAFTKLHLLREQIPSVTTTPSISYANEPVSAIYEKKTKQDGLKYQYTNPVWHSLRVLLSSDFLPEDLSQECLQQVSPGPCASKTEHSCGLGSQRRASHYPSFFPQLPAMLLTFQRVLPKGGSFIWSPWNVRMSLNIFFR